MEIELFGGIVYATYYAKVGGELVMDTIYMVKNDQLFLVLNVFSDEQLN